jgi:ATP-dependent DNA ligase
MGHLLAVPAGAARDTTRSGGNASGVAVVPPIAPMLARLERALPVGDDVVYEPKWDGFRCLAFFDGTSVDLRSRNERPLARYFPEVVRAVRALPVPAVLDGELLASVDGRADFAALMNRLHPAASRVERLSQETPACFVAFDALAVGDDDLRGRPFGERRRRLEALLAGANGRVVVSPLTHDPTVATQWLDAAGGEIDGVVAKRTGERYLPGRRALVKVKRERTADCVLAGFRLFGSEPAVGSLLLGLHDDGVLRHVGVVTSFRRPRRRELFVELAPLRVALAAHPWRDGFALEGGPMGRLRGAAGRWTPDMPLDWVPLRPERVVEVAYTQLDGIRFRHPAQFRRWRPDRDAASCTVEQLDRRAVR